jgi:tetratricopeptide (TPR) repeat protein
MTRKKINPLYLTIIIFLFLSPIVFLLFKTAPHWSGGMIFSKTALRQLEETVKSKPSYNNYINLAVAYINNNQPQKSLEPLEMAKALNPNSAVVYNNLGVAYILLKRIDEGIAACRRALELDPSSQLAKNNLNWGLSEKEKLKGE